MNNLNNYFSELCLKLYIANCNNECLPSSAAYTKVNMIKRKFIMIKTLQKKEKKEKKLKMFNYVLFFSLT